MQEVEQYNQLYKANGYKDDGFPENMSDFGKFIFLRTYSRWMADQKRRETYREMVDRVAEYNVSLDSTLIGQEREREKQDIIDYMMKLAAFPSGRTMWIGGTSAVQKSPLANFNCSFKIINSFQAFMEGFYLLLVGAGFGFRVLSSDIVGLPKINQKIVLANKPYNQKIPHERREDTVAFEGDQTVLIVVGDDKTAWCRALEKYLESMQRKDIDSIIINYDSVRPKGEVLKTFGGRSSGYGALRDIFKKLHTVLTLETDQGVISPLNAMDIMTIIAEGVVVGGVRRSSLICLFDPDNNDILDAKVGLHEPTHKNYGKTYRYMSNNTVFFQEKPSKAYLHTLVERIKQSYEPGILNAESARKKRPSFNGVNPCSEILLDTEGLCNLVELNYMAFIEEGTYDIQSLIKAIRLLTRMSLRMTLIDLELPSWNQVQKRDRLLGVSTTGDLDFRDALQLSDKEFNSISAVLRQEVHEEARRYAFRLRVPEPLLCTTKKPSGTISQLPVVSSGAHRSFAPFFIRRVRITSTDPLAKVMLDSGFPIFPENGQGPIPEQFLRLSKSDQYAALEKATTWVVEFPIKTHACTQASEESALQQYQRYLDYQKYWTDHNTSITISVGSDEWTTLIDTIYNTWEEYIAVSFIAKDTDVYQLMPYETITEEEYLRRAETVIHMQDMYSLLTQYEREDLATDLIDQDCLSGACPIR